jgi:hypothetical protein
MKKQPKTTKNTKNNTKTFKFKEGSSKERNSNSTYRPGDFDNQRSLESMRAER